MVNALLLERLPGTTIMAQSEVAQSPNKPGLMCFKDANRACGPDCMAFLHPPPQDKEYQNQQWARCSILVSEHRTSKHLVIIASELTKISRKLGVEPAPAPGANIPPPPTR